MRYQRLAHTMIFAFRRLRDPQVQVWVMAGFAVLLVLIGHLRAWSPSGEGKNSSTASPSRLLLAGARVSWTEEFGPAQRPSHRPVLVLSGPVSKASASAPARLRNLPAPSLDVRAAMQEAAGKSWQFLGLALRQQLGAAAKPATALKIRLSWSGDQRGNAALIASRKFPADSPAAAFVIGNGSRSGDGRIELISAHCSFADGVVDIILVGQGTGPTPRQSGALGELLNHLEALSGFAVVPQSDSAGPPPAASRLAGI